MGLIEKPQLNLARRAYGARIVIGVIFSVFLIRLWYLQVLKGEYYREQSENNRLQTVYVPPPRGVILDRNGVILARNRPSFNVELVPEDAKKINDTILQLAHYLKLEPEPLLEKVKTMPRRRRYEPRVLLKDVSRDDVGVVIAHQPELPGVIVGAAPARDYPYGTSGSHVLGYVREITKEQLEKPEYSSYRINDIVGQFGIESKWERYLQGKRGIRRVIVNAVGTKIGEASSEAEIPGHTLTLSIDHKVQMAADKALEGKKGAVIALDAKTGEVLALASAPTFDPNVFVGEVSASTWKELTTGSSRAMSNRVVQGAYPPGSVFKVWMGYAGLAEGVIGVNDGPSCLGGYFFAGRTYHCHKRSGHGRTDIYSAIVQSCDVFFYVLGQRLGVDRMHQYATMFGLGSPTGLELVQEAEGLIPSTAWKAEHFSNPGDKKWYPGENLSVVIGQGATTVTPIQMARAMMALVNGGKLFKPTLVKKIESVDKTFIDENFKPELPTTIDLDPKFAETIKKAMVGVVNDPHGTARRAKLPEELGITVGGKTGTAQVVSLDFHKENSNFGHHAWFTGYAPAEDPKIVVTALLEHAGGGGLNSAPVVEKVMEAYFGYIPPEDKPKTSTATPLVQPAEELPEPPTQEEGHAVD